MENKLKPLLVELLGKEISVYELRRLTGLGYSAATGALNDPTYFPTRKTAETLCRTFNIQPGSFLYWRAPGEEG